MVSLDSPTIARAAAGLAAIAAAAMFCPKNLFMCKNIVPDAVAVKRGRSPPDCSLASLSHIPARPSCLPRASFVVIPAHPSLSSPRRRGSPFIYTLGKSSITPTPRGAAPKTPFLQIFPSMCTFPRSQELTLFDCSLRKHTSRSKNTNNGSGMQVFCGQNLFLQAGTGLVGENSCDC